MPDDRDDQKSSVVQEIFPTIRRAFAIWIAMINRKYEGTSLTEDATKIDNFVAGKQKVD